MENKKFREIRTSPVKQEVVKSTPFWNFFPKDMGTDEQIEELLATLFEYPEREFYFYQHVGDQLPEKLKHLKENNVLLMDTVEFSYFEHPNFKNNFICLPGVRTDVWQKEVVRKGPEFRRIPLKLTTKARLDLEIKYRNTKMNPHSGQDNVKASKLGEPKWTWIIYVIAAIIAILAYFNISPPNKFIFKNEKISQTRLPYLNMFLEIKRYVNEGDWVRILIINDTDSPIMISRCEYFMYLNDGRGDLGVYDPLKRKLWE